ncbi:MAG: peptidylprolyl isomerase [Bradymonadaceae bacterium]
MLLEPTQAISSLAALLVLGMILACDRGSENPQAPADPPSEERVLGVASGDEEVAEPAIVWVNDVPIHRHDVEGRLDQLQRLYRHSRRPFDAKVRDGKRRHVIDRLIEKELLRQHIASLPIEIDDEAVDDAFQEQIKMGFGSTDALQRYLDEQELSLSDYRRQIRNELALAQLLDAENIEASITEEEVRELYERIATRRPARERVEASMILVRTPLGTHETVRERMRVATEKAVVRLKSEEEFAALARKMSQGPTAEKGGYVGWVERGVLPVAVDEIVFESEPGKATSPIATSKGFEVYWVHQQRPAGVRSFDEVEDVLRARARQSKTEQARRELIRELRSAATVRFADSPGDGG